MATPTFAASNATVAARLAALAMVLCVQPQVLLASDADAAYVAIPGGSYTSVLKLDDVGIAQQVAPFELMARPVSNGEFLEFLRAHPEWHRGSAPAVFVDETYLSHWSEALVLGENVRSDQPVTQVSWFAALAYCEAEGARLPRWSEWEYVAAADESRLDARGDPAWREHILSWYSRSSAGELAPAGSAPPNAYGVQDMHGLVWEWVEDFNSLMVSADNRSQGDADFLKFCGAGAISMADRENYAVLMRTAMLSSLSAESGTRNLGFRCARDLPPVPALTPGPQQ